MMSDEVLDSSHDVVYHCDEMFDFETISGAFFILIFVFSITGNILLMCVLLVYVNLKNVTNLFILNLVCSDLVFTVTLPFWAVYHLHHWVFGDFACKFITALYIAGLYSSIILLTAMTVDRFITVVLHWPSNPVRRQRCAQASCAAAWVISAAASVNDALKVKVETHSIFSRVRTHLMALMSTWDIISKCLCSSSSHLPSLFSAIQPSSRQFYRLQTGRGTRL